MRGFASTKSHPFQFGAPFNKYPRPNEDQREYGDNLYKMLCSWLNLRDSIGSIPEVDKIRNVFMAMFHADQKQVIKKNKKTKARAVPNIVKIDLDKIDTDLKLSNKEKRRLKNILSQIKYREFERQLNKKETRRRNEKPVVHRKPKTIAATDKNRGTRRSTMRKPKERKSWQKCECDHCELCSVEEKSLTRRNHRRSSTTITPSEERIIKTLMNVDRSCCSEPFKRLFEKRSKRAFMEQNQNINIENLEFKYIQPTCLLQFSGNKVSMVDVLNRPGSGFCLEDSFLSSAFGSKCKQFDRGNRSSCCLNNSLHTNCRNSSEECKGDRSFEKIRSTCQQEKQTDIHGEFDLEEDMKSINSFLAKNTRTDSANIKALLASGDHPRSSKSDSSDLECKHCKQFTFEDNKEYGSELNVPKKTASKYQKLKSFAKKCFCMCGNEDDRNTNSSRHGRKQRNVNNRLNKRFDSPNAQVKNMTDHEFFERKKEINKKTFYI